MKAPWLPAGIFGMTVDNKKKSIREEEERVLFLFLKDTDTPAVIDFYLTRARRFLHSRVIPEGAEMRRFTCFRDVGQHFLLLIFFFTFER